VRAPTFKIDPDLWWSATSFRSDPAVLERLLGQYAYALRQYAADILQGDFRVFPDLEKPVRKNEFSELAQKHYRYLVEVYGFALVDEIYSLRSFGNCQLRFESDTAGVKITKDRGQVFVEIGSLSIPDSEWKGLQSLAGDEVPIDPDETKPVDERYDDLVSRQAQLLREYCDSLLRGNFEAWNSR
jgi:hypothetical protein